MLADLSNGDLNSAEKDHLSNGISFQHTENGTNPREAQSMLLERIASEMNRLKFYITHEQVKSRAMEIAKLIENEDGVAAAVDAFHRHLPSELPLPWSFPQEDDQPNPLQLFFIQIGKLCCLPCGS